MWVALAVQGKGKPQKHECVCPLSLYVDHLSLGLSESLLFRDSLLVLVLVQGLLFQSPGRALPICPSHFLGRVLSCCVFPWDLAYAKLSAPSSSFLAVAFSLQSLGGIPAFPGLRGSGCSYHYFASLTHAPASGNRYDEPFTHLPFVCLLLSEFLNSECFKKSHNIEVFLGWKRGSAAVIGSTRGPPKGGPISASLP